MSPHAPGSFEYAVSMLLFSFFMSEAALLFFGLRLVGEAAPSTPASGVDGDAGLADAGADGSADIASPTPPKYFGTPGETRLPST